MVVRSLTQRNAVKRPWWFWAVAGTLPLAVVAIFLTEAALTVEADVQLARPAATLPPRPPANALSRFAVAHPHPLADALHGFATWYGAVRDGHFTASGERFDMTDMTAAHKSLPFGTIVRVIDLRTKKSVVVRVNDRGTLPGNHVIDLSYAAAEELNLVKTGIAQVRLEIVKLGGKKEAASSN
jgi:rare lipoprotein A